MPFELGLCFGAREFGGKVHQDRDILILDSQPFRYQKYISDLNGYDPKVHGNRPNQVFDAIRSWLNGKTDQRLPHGSAIAKKYIKYRRALPKICSEFGWTVEEMKFVDKVHAMQLWLTVADETSGSTL